MENDIHVFESNVNPYLENERKFEHRVHETSNCFKIL